MTSQDMVGLTSGEGPLGTGVFLLRPRVQEDGQLHGEAWALAVFLPLFPRGRVRLTEKEGRLYDEARSGPLPTADLARTYARGAAGLAFVLASLAMAYLCVAESSWFAGLGVLIGGALPLALIGWLDQTMRRMRRHS